MKRLLLVLLLIVATTPLFAQGAPPRVRPMLLTLLSITTRSSGDISRSFWTSSSRTTTRC